MTDLSKFFAPKPSAAPSSTPAEQANASPDVSIPQANPKAIGTSQASASGAATASIQPASEQAVDEGATPAPAGAATPSFGPQSGSAIGNPFARLKLEANSESDDAESARVTGAAPAIGHPFAGRLPVPNSVGPADSGVASVNDVNESGAEESASLADVLGDMRASQFADETPATAPIRDLTQLEALTNNPDEVAAEKARKQMLGFIGLIDQVYETHHDPELLSGVIRSIMMELKQNPNYINNANPIVHKTDVRTWVRAMRHSMGLAQIRKSEKKSSRGSGKASAVRKIDAGMLADIEALGLGDFGDLG
jgi:hypothetical protein